jgi:hypothetical protein
MVGGSVGVLQLLPPLKLVAMILLKENTMQSISVKLNAYCYIICNSKTIFLKTFVDKMKPRISTMSPKTAAIPR